MARINISIKDELKARMDKHPGFNWSEVASEAFNNKILQTEKFKETTSMADAISRLKASKELYNQGIKTKGYEDGHAWAMKRAEYEELKRLDEWYQEIMNSFHSELINYEGLKYAITSDGNYDLVIFEDDAPITDGDYIEGFTEGCLAVFAEVEKDNS